MRHRAVLLITCLLVPNLALGSTKNASRHVREGIGHFKKGDYKAASQSFIQADVALPENPRVAFNQACAFAAQNDIEKAIELFQRAALSQDSELVAASHYNLGCVAAAKGKAVLGENPVEAPPNVRQEAIQMLAHAVRHYRDCLETDMDHREARHNLEVLRLFIKHMQDQWAKRDREKQREEMNLLEFLEMIQTEQQRLRQATKLLEKEDDSPRRRQAIGQVEASQRQLAEEIDPLKEKINEAVKSPPTSGNATAPPPKTSSTADSEKALELLNNLADQSHDRMIHAADDLKDRSITDSVPAQTEALDALNDIYMAVAPFTQLLSKATTFQQRLVEQSESIVGDSADASTDEDTTSVDYEELARDQTIVSRLSEILPPKARQELTQVQATPTGPSPGPTNPQPNQQHAEQQREALKTALNKAIELSPKIHELTTGAAEDLGQSEAKSALPKQEEALKLLKEIAESLPNQQQNQNQGEQQQDQQQNNDNQQQNQSDQKQQQNQPQRDLSRQQAEAVLRKVRQRGREHRERQKHMRGYIRGSVKVDKDW